MLQNKGRNWLLAQLSVNGSIKNPGYPGFFHLLFEDYLVFFKFGCGAGTVFGPSSVVG
jgi:hypothetical protein